MAALGRRRTHAALLETYVFNSNKAFAAFCPGAELGHCRRRWGLAARPLVFHPVTVLFFACDLTYQPLLMAGSLS
jgi:hypothetical protein